jgi:hypothetical protein
LSGKEKSACNEILTQAVAPFLVVVPLLPNYLHLAMPPPQPVPCAVFSLALMPWEPPIKNLLKHFDFSHFTWMCGFEVRSSASLF